MAAFAPSAPISPDAMRRPKIVVERLGKQFRARNGDVEALRGVNLSVPDGQFCCIVGPSGCGKTTLLRILAGLDEHTDGRLEMVHEDPRRPLTCMLFQDQSPPPWRPGRETVPAGLRMRGVPDRGSGGVVKSHMEKVGLPQSARP